jgi:hypothetical protein
MGKLAKNIFYGISLGLSVLITLWIFGASKSTVGAPVSYGLILMYILTVMALIVALALSAKGMVNKPKSALMSGIGIGVLILFIVIGYFMDDHKITTSYTKYGVDTELYSGIIGGSLIATWIVLGGAVLLTLYASLSDFIKRL